MRASVARFARDESGATSIEYALIATIVGIGVIASFIAIRDGLNDQFNNVSTALSR
jgi:pilus assembly protein Flp/PilA